MQQTDNKSFVFPENTSEIISDILKKYGLVDTEEQIDEKLFGENSSPLFGEITADMVAKFARKEISENDMLAIIQKELNLPKATSESLINDIKTQIMPLVIIVINKTIPEPSIKEATTLEIPPLEKKAEDIAIVPSKKQRETNKPSPLEEIQKITTVSKQSKGPDNYREPI